MGGHKAGSGKYARAFCARDRANSVLLEEASSALMCAFGIKEAWSSARAKAKTFFHYYDRHGSWNGRVKSADGVTDVWNNAFSNRCLSYKYGDLHEWAKLPCSHKRRGICAQEHTIEDPIQGREMQICIYHK